MIKNKIKMAAAVCAMSIMMAVSAYAGPADDPGLKALAEQHFGPGSEIMGAIEKVQEMYNGYKVLTMDEINAMAGRYLRRGVDVSRWQGDINWNKVAQDNISFAMVGVRSKGAIDPYFYKNMQGAANAGLDTGVYIYSLATSVEEAEAEADFVLNAIQGLRVSFPIAFDAEDSALRALPRETVTEMCNAFCRKIQAAGYTPMVYMNEDFMKENVNVSGIASDIWTARYNKLYSYAQAAMWQATETGKINGIDGYCDVNYLYKPY